MDVTIVGPTNLWPAGSNYVGPQHDRASAYVDIPWLPTYVEETFDITVRITKEAYLTPLDWYMGENTKPGVLGLDRESSYS